MGLMAAAEAAAVTGDWAKDMFCECATEHVAEAGTPLCMVERNGFILERQVTV